MFNLYLFQKIYIFYICQGTFFDYRCTFGGGQRVKRVGIGLGGGQSEVKDGGPGGEVPWRMSQLVIHILVTEPSVCVHLFGLFPLGLIIISYISFKRFCPAKSFIIFYGFFGLNRFIDCIICTKNK